MKPVNRILINILTALSIAIIVGVLSFLFVWCFSFLGYGALFFVYIFILTGLISFYKLTSILPVRWSIFSFVLNFIFWTAEQVVFEKIFHNTVLYQEDGIAQVFILTFGAILFATNKGIIDEVIQLFGVKAREEMRIEKIIKMNR